MRSEDDPEITRLFDEQRRADEATAPALRELLARPRGLQATGRRGAWRIALVAVTVAAAIAGALLLRPARHLGQETELPPAASQLASWKAPTDALLKTPGSDLWTRVPVLISRSSQVDPSHPVQTTKGVGE
jgi:anti-sigma-K factor RskA